MLIWICLMTMVDQTSINYDRQTWTTCFWIFANNPISIWHQVFEGKVTTWTQTRVKHNLFNMVSFKHYFKETFIHRLVNVIQSVFMLTGIYARLSLWLGLTNLKDLIYVPWKLGNWWSGKRPCWLLAVTHNCLVQIGLEACEEIDRVVWS